MGSLFNLKFVSSFFYLETRIQLSSFLSSAGAPNPVPNLAALRDTKVFSVFLDGKVFPPLPLINEIIIITILKKNISQATVCMITGNAQVAINQSLGPFAPVKTIHADIVFDILNMTPVGQVMYLM